MSDIQTALKNLRRRGILGDEKKVTEVLESLVRQFKREPVRISNELMREFVSAKRIIPHEIRENEKYKDYVDLSEKLIHEFFLKKNRKNQKMK